MAPKVTDCKNKKSVKNQGECADCCDKTFDSTKEKRKNADCKKKCLGSSIPNRCAQTMIANGDMKKGGTCTKEQKNLDGCNACCGCRHQHLPAKIPLCERQCSKKFKTNDPKKPLQDVPQGYELDSFEIGTESDEIHELEDEYEFGAHDEYEEVTTVYKDKCMSRKAYNAWKGKKSYKAVVTHLKQLAKKFPKDANIAEALTNVQSLFAKYDKTNCRSINDSLLPEVERTINALLGSMFKKDVDPNDILSDFVTSLKDKGKNFRRLQEKEQSGYDLGTLVGYSSYEAIPDYLRNSLKPKKSVHPVYGKLRY